MPPPTSSVSVMLFRILFVWALLFANFATTANTLIVRRGYRRRRNLPVPSFPSPPSLARLLLRVRALERAVRDAERDGAMTEEVTIKRTVTRTPDGEDAEGP